MGRLHRFEQAIMASPFRRWQLDWVDAPLLFRGVQVSHFRRVLEIGCGAGVGTLNILRRLAPDELVACDVDEEMVQRASSYVTHRGQGGRVKFLTADASALPFAANSFDAVVSFAVLHHVAEYRAIIAEVARVLTPDGVYLLSDVLGVAHAWPIQRLMPAEVLFSERELVQSLSDYGLRPAVVARYFPGCIFLRCEHAC